MNSILTVTTALANRNLTTLARAREDLGLTSDEADPYVNRLIATSSDAIARFFNIRADQDGRVTLGRETMVETWRALSGDEMLILARAPVYSINAVTEDSVETKRLLGNTDGAIDIGVSATTLNSASGPEGSPFSADQVGQAISVAGAGADGAAHETTIAERLSDTAVRLTDAALTTVAGAAYALDNPAYRFECQSACGMLWKLDASGYRTAFTASVIAVDYSAGWTLPDPNDADAAYTLPQDIEDACVMMVMRKNQQLREGASGQIESESFPGIGSWKFALEKITWEGGLPSDVKAMLTPYRRLHV